MIVCVIIVVSRSLELLYVVFCQMIANNPLLTGNPELQQQMTQMLPTMLERVCFSCFIDNSVLCAAFVGVFSDMYMCNFSLGLFETVSCLYCCHVMRYGPGYSRS